MSAYSLETALGLYLYCAHVLSILLCTTLKIHMKLLMVPVLWFLLSLSMVWFLVLALLERVGLKGDIWEVKHLFPPSCFCKQIKLVINR